MMPTPRPTNLEEFDALTQTDLFGTEAGYEAGLAFQPRPDDIIISPHAKSGTTWLQHIAHGLRTRGSMDFDEITDVTPWIEMAYDYGWDLEAEQVAEPRLFKSHFDWHKIPKGARYICSIRDPHTVAVSHYRFLEGWWFETASIDIDDFIRARMLRDPQNRGYWQHVISWWEQLDNPDVLLLCYEDMVADLPSTIRCVAHFMGIDLDEALFEIVLRQSTRDFMLAHKSHFDDHLLQQHFERRGGVAVPLDTAKVTPGAPDDPRYQLSQSLKDELDAAWRETLTPRFGFEDYAALRDAFATLAHTKD